MRTTPRFELPADRRDDHRRGVKIAWATIIYLLSAITLLYFVRGNSQAVKTAWLDDMLALIPPIVFLLSSRFSTREPDAEHPYGFHRAPTLAFLAAALALFTMGAYLFIEAAMKLATAEHPSIGTLNLFGHTVWLGWPIAVVMVYKIAVGSPLGIAQQRPAVRTHNKVLYAASAMTRADWQTAAAAGIGVLLVGLGWWWADAAAAMLISLSIVRDGVANVRTAAGDILDRHPKTLDRRLDPLPGQLKAELERSPLVGKASVRLREAGQVLFGEGVIEPWRRELTAEEVADLGIRCKEFDWRIQEFTLGVVPDVDGG